MRNYRIFLKKELVEYFKTYKLILLVLIFAIFGITNPLLAKLTPVILEKFAESGAKITLPEPTAIDAWMQFFKNATQMGLIILVIIFSGILATEQAKGTLINLLTKGLNRTSVVLAKYTAMLIAWSGSLLLCFALSYGYTKFLFPGKLPKLLVFAVFCLWLFGAFLLAMLLFFAVLSNTHYGSMIGTGIVIMLEMLINMLPKVKIWNPLSLVNRNMELVRNQIAKEALFKSLGLTTALTIILVVMAVMVFKKKKL